MRNEEYWKVRFEQLEKVAYTKGRRYEAHVRKQYAEALARIEDDVNAWYARYADTNGVTFSEAKRLLKTKELSAFRMSVEEYVKKGESLDPAFREQLEKASVKFHVSRLEALKMQMQAEVESLNGLFAKEFDDFAFSQYHDQYYRTLYEVQKGLRVGWDVTKLDRKLVDKVIHKPWVSDGRNFSERVWANRSKLVNELHTALTQSTIRGDDPARAIKQISERMGVGANAAGRLVMTENAFFASAAKKDAFNFLEVEKFKILATLDKRTSRICRSLDGKVFSQSDYKVGETAPPFHVYCRTTTIPYFDDEEEFTSERAARDENGRYYTVPSTMTYNDWEKTFVKGGKKEGLKPVSDVLDVALAINEAAQIYQAYGKEHYTALNNLLSENGTDDLRTVWKQFEGDLKAENVNHSGGAYFSSGDGGIWINLKKDAKGSHWSLPYQTTFHEFGHNIDFLANGKNHLTYYSTAFENGVFPTTIREEVGEWLSKLEGALKNEFKVAKKKGAFLYEKGLIDDWTGGYIDRTEGDRHRWRKKYAYKALEKELMQIAEINRSALSDIIEGVTNAKVQAGFGHGLNYWKARPQGVEREAFAEFWECIANPTQWETIKRFLPKSAAVFERMVKELAKNGKAVK